MLEILRGGIQATIQDCGRTKYQAIGIPPSGAFDNYALRAGNLIVGNKVGGPLLSGNVGDAGIEITWESFEAKVLKRMIIAITGADLNPTLNEEPLPMWKAVTVNKNDLLSFPKSKSGCRAYLCIAGGIDVPIYLGSRSTYIKGCIGGLKGRSLKQGDIIKVGEPKTPLEKLEDRKLKTALIPTYAHKQKIRVILGPQDYLFTDEGIDLFLKTEWKVSHRVDRVGYRYIGPSLPMKPLPEYLRKIVGETPSNIVDDPTIPGSIQWTSTELICLGVDAVTLGGFAKPATVVSTDLSKIGQSNPDDIHIFNPITVDEANMFTTVLLNDAIQ